MLPLLFSLLGVLSVKADFTTKYKSSGYWAAFEDQVPAGLQNVINSHVGESTGHTTNYVTYPVEVSATGEIRATVQFDSGSDRLEILGMDILNAEDAVVAYDYHYGYAGSNSENQSKRVYTLSNVDAGSYTIRIFVCSNNSGHNVANSNGTITFVGSVTEKTFPERNAQVNKTHYFQIKSAAYGRFLVSDFTDNKPYSKSGPYNNTPNSLWAFEDAGDGKYYIRSCETGLYLKPYEGQGTPWELTETKFAFEVGTFADAKAHEASKHYFKYNNNNEVCLHDPNWGSGEVVKWNYDSDASHWNLIKTNISTSDRCTILTYNFNYDGSTRLSQTSSLWSGSEYPNYSVVFPYGYTPEAKPEGTVSQSGRVTQNIQLTKSQELPFKSYASASEIKSWYYVQMHGNAGSEANPIRGYLKDATENISYADKTQPTEVSDIHMWGFVGDAFGMKMVNKSTGKVVKSTGGGVASLSSNIDEGTAFVVTVSRDQAKPWFCFKYPSNNNYLNAQDNVVKHWGANDNGSSMLVSEADINVTVGTTGYATFYSSSKVTIPVGVQAYVVTAANTSATLTPVTGVLPANTGVILKNAGEYAFKISTEEPQSVTSLLRGSTVNTYYDEEAYVLSKVGEQVGLYKAQMVGGKWLNNANKAYLPKTAVSGSGARFLTFDFDDNAETGINAVEIEEAAPANAAIYDLSGRRVQSAKSGLYIINGKKVIK